jgi:predicted acyl esterase
MTNIRWAQALVCALAAVAFNPAVAQDQASPKVSRFGEYSGYSPALYSESVRTSTYLQLPNGTRLAMDLYRPAVNGQAVDTPYPVLWQHSLMRRRPPDQGDDSVTRRMPELVKHGYVVAEIERRGLGASFGARRGYNDRNEARDAFEVTQWLARQPWSTGKVGVYGCSNTGDAAMHAASYAPPALKAVFAGCFSWSKYDGFLRGGILAQWGVGPEQPIEDQLRNATPVDGDDSRTLLRVAVEEHRNATPLAAMWRSLPFRDSWSDIVASRFWLEGSVSTYREALQRGGAAFYIHGGWSDEFRREGLVAWASLRNNPARITIGPWLHCRNPGFNLLAEAHRFFDHHLKGVDNGINREPPLHLLAAGAPAASAWRAYDTWPPVADGSDAASGATKARQMLPITSATLTVNKPAPCAEAAALTQPCSQADSGLRYTGPVLQADTELTGHPLLQLWMSSPLPDQHVFAYLEDVAPDGSVTIASEGRLKASLRAQQRPPYDTLGLPWHRSLEADHQPLVAGVPVQLQVDLLPLSRVFKAGHQLRLVISGNDPRERNTGPTGHMLTVLSDADHPSFIALPLIKSR